MNLAFFGLSKESAVILRKNLFSQIHEIVFHGKGGYTWSDVYSMPTWQRKFVYHEIKNFYEGENKSNNPQNMAINQDGTVNHEAFKEQQNVSPPVSRPGVLPKNRPTTYK